MIIIYVLAGIVVWSVIGAGVWSAVDSPDEEIYQWYKNCPSEIALIARPLVLLAWPAAIWMKLRGMI